MVDSGDEASPLSRRARELAILAQSPDASPEDVRRIAWVLTIITHATDRGRSFSDEVFEKIIAADSEDVAQTIAVLTAGKRVGKKIRSGAVPTPRTLWRWLNEYL